MACATGAAAGLPSPCHSSHAPLGTSSDSNAVSVLSMPPETQWVDAAMEDAELLEDLQEPW